MKTIILFYNLAKLWFFKRIRTKSKLLHRYYVTEKHHQNNVTRLSIFGSSQLKFLAMPVVEVHHDVPKLKQNCLTVE